MVASTARDELSKENSLIEAMIQTVQNYSKESAAMTDICKAWVDGLTRHAEMNTDYIGKSDADFDSDVEAEISLLSTWAKSVEDGENLTRRSWRDHLDDDIRLLKALL